MKIIEYLTSFMIIASMTIGSGAALSIYPKIGRSEANRIKINSLIEQVLEKADSDLSGELEPFEKLDLWNYFLDRGSTERYCRPGEFSLDYDPFSNKSRLSYGTCGTLLSKHNLQSYISGKPSTSRFNKIFKIE